VRGHLRLTGCTFTGQVKLLGAKVAGAMLLDGAALSNPAGAALTGMRAEIAGDLSMLGGLTCEGEVQLAGAHIGGSLLLDGARLSAPGRVVLAADNIEVRESIRAEGARLAGEACLRHAVIGGRLYLAGAAVPTREKQPCAARGSRPPRESSWGAGSPPTAR
jgi:hypothetical protein